MAVSALVLGIVGLVLSLNVFTSFTGLICGILAIIFGAIGVSKKDNDKGKGIAGIVLGGITLVIIVVLVIVIINVYDSVSSYIDTNLPKLIEEITETVEEYLSELQTAVDEYIEDIKNDFIKEMERSQRNAIRNLF